MSFKKRVYEVLEVGGPGDRLSRIVDAFILLLIALNVLAIVAESVNAIEDAATGFLRTFEIVSIIIFSIEYGLRLWSCTSTEKYKAPVKGRLRFMITPSALTDLLAVLPFYVGFITAIVGIDLRVLRIFRLFRFFRLAKLARYSRAIRAIGSALYTRREELVVTVVIIFLLLVLASSAMYFAEHGTQPDKFSSIPASMWWAVATLSTVGYGDVVPMTPVGRLLAAVIAFLGIGIFALPTGILGSAFVEQMEKHKGPTLCPSCGKEIPTRRSTGP